MAWFIFKTVLSGLLIAVISSLGKKYSGIAAILASIPLISVMAFIWMNVEGAQSAEIQKLSWNILKIMPPSTVLFVALPLLLRGGLTFPWALSAACFATVGTYFGYLHLLKAVGINL